MNQNVNLIEYYFLHLKHSKHDHPRSLDLFYLLTLHILRMIPLLFLHKVNY